jgi:protein gp37
MGASSIEWTDATWNPIKARLPEEIALHQHKGLKVLPAGTTGYHCEHVSPGCLNCYAEKMNMRTLPAWGTGFAYNVPNRQRVEIVLDGETLMQPLQWKKPRMIFVCSMTDLYAEFVPESLIDNVFAVAAVSPQHTFQVLTKRPERMRRYFADLGYRQEMIGIRAEYISGLDRYLPDGLGATWKLPFPNVWLGVSVED